MFSTTLLQDGNPCYRLCTITSNCSILITWAINKLYLLQLMTPKLYKSGMVDRCVNIMAVTIIIILQIPSVSCQKLVRPLRCRDPWPQYPLSPS